MEKALVFLILDAISPEHQMPTNVRRLEAVRDAIADGRDFAEELEPIKEHLEKTEASYAEWVKAQEARKAAEEARKAAKARK